MATASLSPSARPTDTFGPASAREALNSLWRAAGLPDAALPHIDLRGAGAGVPSSFAVADAAQASLAAAALAAAEIRHARGHGRQAVTIERAHVLAECSAWFSIDGLTPPLWDKISGLYHCGDALGAPGWVRIHANFAHHRDGALRLLGCGPGPDTERAAVTAALRHWRAEDFEAAAAEAGLVVAAVRSFDAWDRHPQAAAVAQEPVRIERIGDADPQRWPDLGPSHRPLSGLRVLDLTRILAGPVACRTLAAYGAEVLMINAPHLPNIDAIADLSRGKRSAQLDLRRDADRETLRTLAGGAQVFVQGYRPGGLAALGFDPVALARLRPGIVCASLSAYGPHGPWANRRGFDSLVQTATGFNDAEARAAGAETPQALPFQVLDFAAGFLLAFGISAALWQQQREGGSWQVEVSLAATGRWLRRLGRVADGFKLPRTEGVPSQYLMSEPSGFGHLVGVRHAAQMAATPPLWRLPSMPPGSHPAVWTAPSPAHSPQAR